MFIQIFSSMKIKVTVILCFNQKLLCQQLFSLLATCTLLPPTPESFTFVCVCVCVLVLKEVCCVPDLLLLPDRNGPRAGLPQASRQHLCS